VLYSGSKDAYVLQYRIPSPETLALGGSDRALNHIHKIPRRKTDAASKGHSKRMDFMVISAARRNKYVLREVRIKSPIYNTLQS
jgi:hypothetical protein